MKASMLKKYQKYPYITAYAAEIIGIRTKQCTSVLYRTSITTKKGLNNICLTIIVMSL